MVWLAKIFIEKKAEYETLNKDLKVTIGFHCTNNQNLKDIRINGLTKGTYAEKIPSTFAKEDVGLIVAVLVDNEQRFTIKQSQCLPLIRYPNSSILSNGFWLQKVLAFCQNQYGDIFNDILSNGEKKKVTQICEICVDSENDDFHELLCGHSYCRSCWNSYLRVMFEQNFGRATLLITCPESRCQQIITPHLIQEVAPELLPKYERQRLQSFVSGNHTTLQWCPGPECNKVAVQLKNDMFLQPNNTVFCRDGCQTRFCFLCGEAPHDGLCLNLEQTQTEIGIKLDMPKNGLMQNCPGCKTPIEKNGGCNHMRCKCGLSFCWLCGADISDAPYNHQCGRFKPVREKGNTIDLNYFIDTFQDIENDDFTSILTEISVESREKEKFAHYYNRFVAHAQGQRFAEEQCCVNVKANDYYSASGKFDIDFLFTANDCLVQCRRVLKYSYCYIYHITNEIQDIDSVQLALFEDHLERLERFTENLSEATEGALAPVDRKRVIDLTLITRRCLKTMNELGYELQVKPLTKLVNME